MTVMTQRVNGEMTRYEKILAGIYAGVFAAGILVLALDLFVWRADPPQPEACVTQPATPAKKK